MTAQGDSQEPLGKPEQDMASGSVWLPSARRRFGPLFPLEVDPIPGCRHGNRWLPRQSTGTPIGLCLKGEGLEAAQAWSSERRSY